MGSTPLTLRCPKCKNGEDYRRYDRPSSLGIEKTGRILVWGDNEFKQVEVRHTRCGHVWLDDWTGNTRSVGNTHASFATRMANLRASGSPPVEQWKIVKDKVRRK